MADPVAIINRKATSGFDYFGSTTLAAGASCIIWTHGFPSIIGVIVPSEGTKSYTVSEITDTEDDIRADEYTPIAMDTEPCVVSKVVQGKWGVSALEIKNGDSSAAVKVNWRIVRP